MNCNSTVRDVRIEGKTFDKFRVFGNLSRLDLRNYLETSTVFEFHFLVNNIIFSNMQVSLTMVGIFVINGERLKCGIFDQ